MLCRGTFNMRAIRSAFDHAYGTLTMPSVRSDALLSRILRLDDVLAIRPPPVKERPGSATGKHKNGALKLGSFATLLCCSA